MDPLEDARQILALARVVYRTRRLDARRGIQPAEAAARRAETLGKRLADAVARAEAAPAEDRAPLLKEVAQLGERLSADIGAWESIQGLLRVLTTGARGESPAVPGPPRRIQG